MDEPYVDSYFFLNIFDISQSQHRTERVSKGSNEKSFAIKLFQFCDLKTQQRYILQDENNISKRELSSLVDSLRNFVKDFDQASKCLEIPLPKRKVDITSTKSKDDLFNYIIMISFERSDIHIRLSLPFGNNKSCVFSINKFETRGNQIIPTRTVNLTTAKLPTFTRANCTVQTSVKLLAAFTMCSTLNPDCRYDNSII